MSNIERDNRSNATIIPICIVVDISKSMSFSSLHGMKRIERVKEGINDFIKDIRNDDELSDSAEIAVVTYNIDAYTVLDFTPVDRINEIDLGTCNFTGDTSKGVEKALELLENEKQSLARRNSRQPWLVIFSDGRATVRKSDFASKEDADRYLYENMNRVQSTTREMEENKKLTVIPVLISEESDGLYNEAFQQMKFFSCKHRALSYGDDKDEQDFKDFFSILSRSVSVSNADLMFKKDVRVQRNEADLYSDDSDETFDSNDANKFNVHYDPKEAKVNGKLIVGFNIKYNYLIDLKVMIKDENAKDGLLDKNKNWISYDTINNDILKNDEEIVIDNIGYSSSYSVKIYAIDKNGKELKLLYENNSVKIRNNEGFILLDLRGYVSNEENSSDEAEDLKVDNQNITFSEFDIVESIDENETIQNSNELDIEKCLEQNPDWDKI